MTLLLKKNILKKNSICSIGANALFITMISVLCFFLLSLHQWNICSFKNIFLQNEILTAIYFPLRFLY